QHTPRGKGKLPNIRVSPGTDPARGRINRRQGNAGHRRWQGKGQINQGIHNATTRKAVTHQDPGQNQAKYTIDQRRQSGHPKGQYQGSQDARSTDGFPTGRPTHGGGLEQNSRQGDQNNQAQIADGQTHGQAKAWQSPLLASSGQKSPKTSL